MSTYTGSLRIVATDDVVPAEFNVTNERLIVKSGGDTLGDWPLRDIDIDDTGTEIYLALAGEEVIVNIPNRDAFVSEIEPPKNKKKIARHAKPKRQKQPRERRDILGAVRGFLDRDRWRDWLSDRVVRWSIASVVVIGVALLALFATASLGMILVLIGMVALIVAALAVTEDLSAVSWVPGEMSETLLVIVGAALMVVGGLLIVLG